MALAGAVVIEEIGAASVAGGVLEEIGGEEVASALSRTAFGEVLGDLGFGSMSAGQVIDAMVASQMTNIMINQIIDKMTVLDEKNKEAFKKWIAKQRKGKKRSTDAGERWLARYVAEQRQKEANAARGASMGLVTELKEEDEKRLAEIREARGAAAGLVEEIKRGSGAGAGAGSEAGAGAGPAGAGAGPRGGTAGARTGRGAGSATGGSSRFRAGGGGEGVGRAARQQPREAQDGPPNMTLDQLVNKFDSDFDAGRGATPPDFWTKPLAIFAMAEFFNSIGYKDYSDEEEVLTEIMQNVIPRLIAGGFNFWDISLWDPRLLPINHLLLWENGEWGKFVINNMRETYPLFREVINAIISVSGSSTGYGKKAGDDAGAGAGAEEEKEPPSGRAPAVDPEPLPISPSDELPGGDQSSGDLSRRSSEVGIEYDFGFEDDAFNIDDFSDIDLQEPPGGWADIDEIIVDQDQLMRELEQALNELELEAPAEEQARFRDVLGRMMDAIRRNTPDGQALLDRVRRIGGQNWDNLNQGIRRAIIGIRNIFNRGRGQISRERMLAIIAVISGIAGVLEIGRAIDQIGEIRDPPPIPPIGPDRPIPPEGPEDPKEDPKEDPLPDKDDKSGCCCAIPEDDDDPSAHPNLPESHGSHPSENVLTESFELNPVQFLNPAEVNPASPFPAEIGLSYQVNEYDINNPLHRQNFTEDAIRYGGKMFMPEEPLAAPMKPKGFITVHAPENNNEVITQFPRDILNLQPFHNVYNNYTIDTRGLEEYLNNRLCRRAFSRC